MMFNGRLSTVEFGSQNGGFGERECMLLARNRALNAFSVNIRDGVLGVGWIKNPSLQK